jgi:hypothetical protein
VFNVPLFVASFGFVFVLIDLRRVVVFRLHSHTRTKLAAFSSSSKRVFPPNLSVGGERANSVMSGHVLDAAHRAVGTVLVGASVVGLAVVGYGMYSLAFVRPQFVQQQLLATNKNVEVYMRFQ